MEELKPEEIEQTDDALPPAALVMQCKFIIFFNFNLQFDLHFLSFFQSLPLARVDDVVQARPAFFAQVCVISIVFSGCFNRSVGRVF